MASISLKSKYLIFPAFSTVPKTEKLEQEKAALRKELDDLIAFGQSQELADFKELEQELNSDAFRKKIEQRKQKKESELAKIKSYEASKKSKSFKKYFDFRDSQRYKEYLAFLESPELSEYNSLNELVNSSGFIQEQKEAKDRLNGFQQKLDKKEQAEKTSNIRFYLKFSKSPGLGRFRQLEDSEQIRKYGELKKKVTSPEFQQKKASMSKKEFLSSPEGREWEAFRKMKKADDIRFYEKYGKSSKYRRFKEIENSGELRNYQQLLDETGSDDFRKGMEKAQKELNELNDKQTRLDRLRKSAPIRSHFKFEGASAFKTFNEFSGSKELKDFEDLGNYLDSEEHKETMQRLDEEEKVAAARQKEYEEFRDSDKYKWYLGVKDSDKFDEIKRWHLTFEDDFSSSKLDVDKWITRYYWGDKLINDSYALDRDLAFPANDNNINIAGKILKIEVRQEKTEGKVWQPPFGFVPKDFEYTTGLISTGKNFRQKYGKFEAKIRANYSKPLDFNFWLASDKILPQVNVMRVDSKKTKIEVSHHWGDAGAEAKVEKSSGEMKGLDASRDFFIYTLEWSPEKLVWKINDVIVHEQTQGIPNEEMYMVFNVGLTKKPSAGDLPASMEIDWVRCYKEAK